MNEDLLKMDSLVAGTRCPVRVVKIPKLIMKEIDVWVKESRKLKNHPLAELKAHENVGYLTMDGKKHNTYQCSIPPHLIDNSFWLAWVIRLTAAHYGGGDTHRRFRIRSWPGHFDNYDIWTNFSYQGDDNPSHNHAGHLSGVIYYKNHEHPTVFDDWGWSYEGFDGTMAMWPSDVMHHVNPQTADKERITLAFNIMHEDALKK